MSPFTEGVKKTLMEDFQEQKLKRAKKRARNLVSKDNKHRGAVHKTSKDYSRKRNRDWSDFDPVDSSP